jgi:hypothetical protein
MTNQAMTQTISRTTGADIRPAWRWVAAVILPVGPVAVALLRFLLPYYTADDSATITSKIVGHLDRTSVVLWLSYIAFVTLVPGVYFVGRLARRGAPWLTGIALCLMVPGYLSLPWLVSSDALNWSAGTAGVDQATITKITEVTHGSVDVAGIAFVAGHVLGTIVLGAAMWRSGVGGRWAAAAVAVSQPLHLISVIISSHPLDLVGWGLQAVGFAAVGWAILRMPNDEWQPLP